jgi:hypothetical protein
MYDILMTAAGRNTMERRVGQKKKTRNAYRSVGSKRERINDLEI